MRTAPAAAAYLLAVAGISGLFLSGCNDQTLNTLPATNSEIHYQGGGAPPVDVLWVVDNSGSMADEQAKLAASFNSFIHYFEDLHLDFHLAVTTTDTLDQALSDWNGNAYPVGEDGKFVGVPAILTPELDPTTLEQAFGANVNVGTQGWVVERGLEAARLALSEPNLSGANAGFLRPNAVLAVILVSDEEDQSVADNSVPPSQAKADDSQWRQDNLEDTNDFINFFLGLKGGNQGMVNVSAIVGLDQQTLLPAACQSDSTADPGVRYYDVAKALHGVLASICDSDFGPILDQIGGTVSGLVTSFALQYTPDPNSITVTVDGNVVQQGPNGWSYDPNTNTISFAEGAVPAQCAVVEIDYGVADFNNGITTGNNEVPPAQCGVVAPVGGNSLEGGAFSCDVDGLGGSYGLGALLAAAAVGLGLMLRRRREAS